MSTRDEAVCVLSNQTAIRKCIHSVSVFGENVTFTDVGSCQIKMLITTDGSGNTGNNDGTSTTAMFAQLQGLCSEDNTLYVTEITAGCVKIVTGLFGMIKFPKNLI